MSASATTAAGGSAAFMTGAASGGECWPVFPVVGVAPCHFTLVPRRAAHSLRQWPSQSTISSSPPPPLSLPHADLDPQWAARLEQRLLAGVREMLRPEEGSDGTSEATPGDYEAAGRAHLLSIFEDTFGLRVVYNASPHRLRVDIERTQLIDSLEWDFRVPVMWSGTPARSHKSNDLVIFPDMDSYMRPPMPARAHRLTPTKVPGATEDTSSDFMAIFEITVVTTWAKSSQSGWSSGLW